MGNKYTIDSGHHILFGFPDAREIYIAKPGYMAEIRQKGYENVKRQLTQSQVDQLRRYELSIEQLQ